MDNVANILICCEKKKNSMLLFYDHRLPLTPAF